MKKIGIFCVGTGGHVLPAKNIINELNDKNIGLENIVVITDKRGVQYFDSLDLKIHIENIYIHQYQYKCLVDLLIYIFYLCRLVIPDKVL